MLDVGIVNIFEKSMRQYPPKVIEINAKTEMISLGLGNYASVKLILE